MSSNNQAKSSDRNWNSKKFIDLSNNLSSAYGLGLNNDKPTQEEDSWTADKLISMSRHLSSAYGVDFKESVCQNASQTWGL